MDIDTDKEKDKNNNSRTQESGLEDKGRLRRKDGKRTRMKRRNLHQKLFFFLPAFLICGWMGGGSGMEALRSTN